MKGARTITLVLVALLLPLGSASARSVGLDQWFKDTLVPHVVDRIAQHPRFRNETLFFVVLDDDQPAPVSNALALSLRDALLEAAVDTQGVKVAWQQRPWGNSSCFQDTPDYFIGIAITPGLSGSHTVTVRALDAVEREWVSGFGIGWEGTLSRRQLARYRQTERDQSFLGTRDVPYTEDQADLIARHLSHRLSCDIHRALVDEYVVAIDSTGSSEEPLANTVALAIRNLDANDAVTLTANGDAANSGIDGKAHPIDGRLHQYWLTITPQTAGADLDSVSASVYVRLNEAAATAPAVAITSSPRTDTQPARVTGVVMPGSQYRELLQPLSMYPAGSVDDCRYPDCALLRARARDDVIIFTLMQSATAGLVRLTDSACRERSAARVVTKGHSALFPVPGHDRNARAATYGDRWLIEPSETMYYAIAVDNGRDARRLATLIDELPQHCGTNSTAGLKGYALQEWLEDLSHLMLKLGRHAEWRAVEVNPVY